MKDYDIISVFCFGIIINCILIISMGYQNNREVESMVESEVDKLEDGDSDLEFSVVYFLIGGFDWRD